MSPHPETPQYDPADRHGPADGTASDEPTGPPYRAIAMVLLAAVVLAIAVGLAQLFGGGDDTTPTAEQTPTSQAPQPGTGQVPAGEGQQNGQNPHPSGQPAEPGGEPQNAQAPAAAPGGVDVTSVPVRVFNNSNVTGLAGRTGDSLRAAGFAVSDVANMPSNQGVVPASVAYYGTGPGEQQAAEAIGSRLGIPAQPRPQGFAADTPGVIVIVTQDLNR